jgi:hypothetical protein
MTDDKPNGESRMQDEFWSQRWTRAWVATRDADQLDAWTPTKLLYAEGETRFRQLNPDGTRPLTEAVQRGEIAAFDRDGNEIKARFWARHHLRQHDVDFRRADVLRLWPALAAEYEEPRPYRASVPVLQSEIIQAIGALYPDGTLPARADERNATIIAYLKKAGRTQTAPSARTIQRAIKAARK